MSASGATRLRQEPVGAPGLGERTVVVDDAAVFTLSFPYRRRLIDDAPTALLASRFSDL